MSNDVSMIHPYWFKAISRAYDARTEVIAREAAAIRRMRGNAAEAHLDEMLRLEYGSMRNSDFDSRVGIARGIDSLVRRWNHYSRTVVDINEESLGERSGRLKARGKPIFLSISSGDLFLSGNVELIDGAYIEKATTGSATTVCFVTRRPSLSIDSASLGALLKAQSTAGFGMVADADTISDITVLMCDARLGRDPAFVLARRLVESFLLRLYSSEPSWTSSAQPGQRVWN